MAAIPPPPPKRVQKGRTTSVTTTLPPAATAAARAGRDNVHGNNPHTRPPFTNESIVRNSQYGPRGMGIMLPSPIGERTDRWVRTAPTGVGGRYVGSAATPAPDTSGGGGGWFSGDPVDPGDGGGGGGGGGGPAPTPITWEEKYTVPGGNPPAWWKGLVPVGGLDPTAEFALWQNALIPFMSPEDQRTAGNNLAMLYPNEEKFKAYGLEQTPTPALGPYSSEPKWDYLSAQRAENALATLDKARDVMGKTNTDFGPGYQFLRNIVTVLKNYGATGGDHQTRAQYLGQLGALDPLMSQAKTDALSAYGPMAQQLASPFFSGGSLRNYSRGQDGRNYFGQNNKALY